MFPILFVFSPKKPHYMYSFLNSEYQVWPVMIPFALNEYAQALHSALSAYFYVYSTLVTEMNLSLRLENLM